MSAIVWRGCFAFCVVFWMVACSDSPTIGGDPVSTASTSSASTTGSGGQGGTGSGAGGHAEAGSDPGVPTVVVTPDCVGISEIAVEVSTTRSNEFTMDGRVGFSIALAVGDVIRFSTATDHNFESVPMTPAAFVFKSGEPGAHTACLRFTAPTPQPIGYECDPHAGDGMVGTLTVD